MTTIRALIVSCAFLLLPLASGAATITIDFTGTTTGVGGLATGIWSGQGTEVTGSISYDLALFDDNPSASYDRFNEAIAKNAGFEWSIEYTLGKVTKSYTEAGSTPFVFNLNGVTDQYAFGAGRFNILVNGAGLKLDGTAPDYAPDVANATVAKGYYWIEGTQNRLSFNIKSMEVRDGPAAAMPEPTAAMLFGIGVLVVGGTLRNRSAS